MDNFDHASWFFAAAVYVFVKSISAKGDWQTFWNGPQMP